MLRFLFPVIMLAALPPAFAQPLPGNEGDRRALIVSVREAPGFDQLAYKSQRLLDVYRTMAAAGLALTPEEAYEMGDAARKRGLPIEAVEIWKPLVEHGMLAEASKVSEDRAQSLFEQTVQQADKDRRAGIQQSVSDVSSRWASDQARMLTAEALISVGDYQHAIDMLRAVLMRDQLEEPEAASARLSLCRALIAAGRADEARWELANFEPAPAGYDVLARVWLAIASETR